MNCLTIGFLVIKFNFPTVQKTIRESLLFWNMVPTVFILAENLILERSRRNQSKFVFLRFIRCHFIDKKLCSFILKLETWEVEFITK